MSTQQRKSSRASIAPHECFFQLVEEATRERFAAGDTGEQSPKVFLYRTDADEPLRYEVPDDGEETRHIISALLAWDRCLGVGYLTQVTFESYTDPGRNEALPQPRLVEAIAGIFHSPHDLPRMIRIEIEGRGARRRIGKVRTDFNPTPSAVITPAEFGPQEVSGEDDRSREPDADMHHGKGPDIPQIIRGIGPTIVVLPGR